MGLQSGACQFAFVCCDDKCGPQHCRSSRRDYTGCPSPRPSPPNTILPDGSVAGLSLFAQEELIVRNYPIAITVKSSARFSSTSTLNFVLYGNSWGSTISFAPGIAPALAGTIELDFAPGVDPSLNVGHSYDLFNWGSGLPSGDRFDSVVANAPVGYVWDTSRLYSTGIVTMWAVPVPVPATWAFLSIGLDGVSGLAASAGSKRLQPQDQVPIRGERIFLTRLRWSRLRGRGLGGRGGGFRRGQWPRIVMDKHGWEREWIEAMARGTRHTPFTQAVIPVLFSRRENDRRIA